MNNVQITNNNGGALIAGNVQLRIKNQRLKTRAKLKKTSVRHI